VKRWYANVIKPYWGFSPLPPRQAHGGEFANFIVKSRISLLWQPQIHDFIVPVQQHFALKPLAKWSSYKWDANIKINLVKQIMRIWTEIPKVESQAGFGATEARFCALWWHRISRTAPRLMAAEQDRKILYSAYCRVNGQTATLSYCKLVTGVAGVELTRYKWSVTSGPDTGPGTNPIPF
jgi:hypothetical protein